MGARKRFIGATALSAAALASLAGAGTANADDVCLLCGDSTVPPGLINAFHKLQILDFPGNTQNAFQKVGAQNAFVKLTDLGFPGNTINVFSKFNVFPDQ